MLQVGDTAPDFEVPLGTGERFRLSEHRGKRIVLFFYPRAFTPGCTTEVQGFAGAHDEIIAKNAVVIGISTDGVEKLGRFGEATGAPFALGSDTSKEIRRMFDVERRYGLGTSRVTYVIDEEGIIRSVLHNEITMGMHVDSALSTLESLE